MWSFLAFQLGETSWFLFCSLTVEMIGGIQGRFVHCEAGHAGRMYLRVFQSVWQVSWLI